MKKLGGSTSAWLVPRMNIHCVFWVQSISSALCFSSLKLFTRAYEIFFRPVLADLFAQIKLFFQVLNDNPYNRKCDVYSFGICLWEIYCCDMPYPDLTFSEISSAVVRQVRFYSPPRVFFSNISKKGCSWLKKNGTHLDFRI